MVARIIDAHIGNWNGKMAAVKALGLMSGTSMDGVDGAILTTDGEVIGGFGPHLTMPYSAADQTTIREALGRETEFEAAANAVTDVHIAAVQKLLAEAGPNDAHVELVGFHGHTIVHAPERGVTIQIGNAQRLADTIGIDVIADFRSADVASGGEGAPLAPLFHQALCRELSGPIVVLNIGGVANTTWVGKDGQIVACDTGPGNALLDDWMRVGTGQSRDTNGAAARAGTVDSSRVDRLLEDAFFRLPPPKSLDRDHFSEMTKTVLQGLSVEDGAATLTAFTAVAVKRAMLFFSAAPRRVLVTGGGRHNSAMMAALRSVLQVAVDPVEAVGWQGDALEAQAFAYLAVRGARGLPLSLPATTGVTAPATGGRRFYARQHRNKSGQ